MISIKSVIWFWRRLRGAMLNDLIRGFGQKLRETIRPEICFRLVVFLDASRLADADLEKTTVELLAPSDSLDRFRVLVLPQYCGSAKKSAGRIVKSGIFARKMGGRCC